MQYRYGHTPCVPSKAQKLLCMSIITPRQALEQAFVALAPFSDSDRWEFPSHLIHLESVLALLQKLPSGARVVDVGCYIGILPLALRLLGVAVRGNDKFIFFPRETGKAYGFSPDELVQLKRVWASHDLVIDSFDALSETHSAQYDVVISIATLEHQAYPKQFLESVACFAKEGGYIYIAVPNLAKLANRFRFLLGRPPMQNIEEFYLNAEHFNGHWREYTLQELVRMATLSNLTVVEAKSIQTEPAKFNIWRPRKWLRSIARAVSHVVPGSGDTNVMTLKK